MRDLYGFRRHRFTARSAERSEDGEDEEYEERSLRYQMALFRKN